MVLKPAPQTPLTACCWRRPCSRRVGRTAALNVLPLSNEDASLLVTDERIKLISFTGSAAVGWDIKKQRQEKGRPGARRQCGRDCAQRCRPRLRGRPLCDGRFAYAGQTCISVQRILVERSVCGKFTELLLAG